VVYDSVGKDTWEASLDCLQRRGLMVSFGNSSGPVTGVNLGILNQKGSLYVTRPSLQGYITNREELEEASSELFSLIASGVIKVDVAESQTYPLTEARRAHEVLESRVTQGRVAAAVSGKGTKFRASTWEALTFFSSAVCRVQRDEFVNALIVTDLISNAYAVLCKIVQVVTTPQYLSNANGYCAKSVSVWGFQRPNNPHHRNGQQQPRQQFDHQANNPPTNISAVATTIAAIIPSSDTPVTSSMTKNPMTKRVPAWSLPKE
jgi:hypothetical protein